jgi:hypothetical protein
LLKEGDFEGSAGVRRGDVLAGKYLVDRVLGAGGMGVVVAAHHLQLETNVAVKFLLPEMLSSQDAVARFAREARAAAKITNEHVARVLDVGTLESGAPYIVMELLVGSDLSRRVQERGPLPLDEGVELVLQACEAVAEAHSLGIVHRDLKPANLFCVDRADGIPCVKVLDFGISKVSTLGASGPQFAMTRTMTTMGSPLYMSPEQMESARGVDARTDIWALGIILHELLTGQTPFQGETLPEICVKISTKAPPPLRSLLPQAPPALEAIILRCLEKDRDRRFANVAELAVALGPLASVRAQTSVERITRTLGVAPVAAVAQTGGSRPGVRVPVPGTETNGALGHTQIPRTTPKAGVLIAGAGVVLVAIGALGFLALGHRKTDHADPAAPVMVPPPSTPPAPPPPASAPETKLAPLEPAPREPESTAATTRRAPVTPAHPSHTPEGSTPRAGPSPATSPAAPSGPAPAPARPKSSAPADSDPFSRLKPM